MMHQFILHDFNSGGRKVAQHNAVPWGTEWWFTSSILINVKLQYLEFNDFIIDENIHETWGAFHQAFCQ